jgi:hypothetical protein
MNYIYGILGSIPKLKFSHNSAYAKIWANVSKSCITDDLDSVTSSDTVLLYFGVAFNGESLNLFGGADSKLFERLNAFLSCQAEFASIDFDMPDIGAMLTGRIGNNTTDPRFTKEFLNKISNKCKTVKQINMKDFINDTIVIGDSHSLSMTPLNTPVIYMPGKTMFGITKSGLSEIVDLNNINKLTLSFGSIDIRHHLFRQTNPNVAATKLVTDYLNMITLLLSAHPQINIELCSTVPVEFEGRKLPKTGYYKGTPFAGSRQQRLDVTLMINNMLSEFANTTNRVSYVSFPLEWYEMDPKLFADTIMERPKSVHIGYPFYRLNDFGKVEQFNDEEPENNTEKPMFSGPTLF